ncbi:MULTISPECIES: M15 family metallopeptidase [Virgibacillus]|uniref:Peptidoglycan L-alanyl-D-glutamate endopeptidase CwlK n=1 Tax=Virgibacillus massiliensis TaxID=1462526 RepID=A0A024QFK4_9BACI|nr:MULTISPECIES: M15 family metallopeptidase [Virgibacillus]EQB38866.1 hypothetical protein M948_00555 [Virgibacillus sp. CM-4]MYL43233.1 M15 family peptidase [Virgibacillus massiliensis]CDQ40992.1 Peptidoglycan L-alanyl-D-glutamate endopeptidase CwlK precursor [Virgibacillus massiliensis]
MRKLQQILLPWLLISVFLIILFQLYQGQNEEYTDQREDVGAATELHPTVEEKKNKLIEQAVTKDIHVVITDDVRSFERQEELYQQGRATDGEIVTYAQGGESYHNYGLAIDYALENKNGELIWDIHYDGNNNNQSDWFEVANIAKNLGFEWGGDWEGFKDYPHLQITFGLSIEQLQRGIRPKPAQE